jgi:hypothetical protein
LMINCFHPKYVETYMPEFLSSIRADEAAKANGQKYGTLARSTRESDGTTKSSPLSDFPKTKRVSTAITNFHVYSKAGMPKGVK